MKKKRTAISSPFFNIYNLRLVDYFVIEQVLDILYLIFQIVIMDNQNRYRNRVFLY